MAVGICSVINLQKGYGEIMAEGGGNIRFQPEDVAAGNFENLRGKKVYYEPRLRDHENYRLRRHAAHVKPID